LKKIILLLQKEPRCSIVVAVISEIQGAE
jgi:hypothetical protein